MPNLYSSVSRSNNKSLISGFYSIAPNPAKMIPDNTVEFPWQVPWGFQHCRGFLVTDAEFSVLLVSIIMGWEQSEVPRCQYSLSAGEVRFECLVSGTDSYPPRTDVALTSDTKVQRMPKSVSCTVISSGVTISGQG